jgi:hypothetical protein
MLTELSNYHNDGANWQAKIILAFMQMMHQQVLVVVWNEKFHKSDAVINIGRYENCREQGYVFSLVYKGKQRHYAVYEHRNSDTICVLISNKPSMNTPDVATMWADKPENCTKWDYDKGFDCGQFEECTNFIIEDMTKILKEWSGKEDETNPGE